MNVLAMRTRPSGSMRELLLVSAAHFTGGGKIQAQLIPFGRGNSLPEASGPDEQEQRQGGSAYSEHADNFVLFCTPSAAVQGIYY